MFQLLLIEYYLKLLNDCLPANYVLVSSRCINGKYVDLAIFDMTPCFPFFNIFPTSLFPLRLLSF